MRFLALALMGTTTLIVGTASAAVSITSSSDMSQLAAASVADQTMTAKQSRGGHDDPPGDDHDGLLVIAKQGRGDMMILRVTITMASWSLDNFFCNAEGIG